eukprot:363963-Chlamydomonas_euryale.AAC.4
MPVWALLCGVFGEAVGGCGCWSVFLLTAVGSVVSVGGSVVSVGGSVGCFGWWWLVGGKYVQRRQTAQPSSDCNPPAATRKLQLSRRSPQLLPSGRNPQAATLKPLPSARSPQAATLRTVLKARSSRAHARKPAQIPRGGLTCAHLVQPQPRALVRRANVAGCTPAVRAARPRPVHPRGGRAAATGERAATRSRAARLAIARTVLARGRARQRRPQAVRRMHA